MIRRKHCPFLFSFASFAILLAFATFHSGAQDLREPDLTHPVLLHSDANLSIFARCPTRKVFADGNLAEAPDLVREDSLDLAAARNESEQVSLVIRPTKPLEEVTVVFEAMSEEGGDASAEAIPVETWSWRRVVSLPVEKPSVWYGLGGWETGMIPDPLVPGEPFEAAANANTTLLLEVRVPADIAPGSYVGAIVVSAEGLDPVSIPVNLTVWDIDLPSKPTLQTMACGVHLGNPGLCELAVQSGVTSLKYGSTAMKARYDKESGSFDIATDAYAQDLRQLFDEMGVNHVTLPPSLLGSQSSVSESYISTGVPVGSEAFWPLHDDFVGQMGAFYRKHGWERRVLYNMMDEIQPNLQDVARDVALRAKQQFPEVQVLLTTHELPDDLAGAINIWCVPWHFFATRSEDVHRWDDLRRRGLTLWSYMNSLYTLNADWNPGAMRLFPVALAKYGYEGALWWSLAYYKDQDPWKAGIITLEDTKRDRRHYANGYLVYPPREGETQWHSSLRWENYRQGIDEYELMMLLRGRWAHVLRAMGAKGDDPAFSVDAAMRWWGSLLSSEFRVQTFRRDTAYVQRFRQLIAHEITQLLEPPLALIDCEPDTACAVTSDTLHIRGLCAPGTRVTVAGQEAGDFSETEPFVFVVNARLNVGANLIPIVLTDSEGNEKTLYREVSFVKATQDAVEQGS